MWKGTTRAVVALKTTKALRLIRVGDEKRLLARAACETLIELVRDSADVFPPLKAAAGGLTNVLKQLRVRDVFQSRTLAHGFVKTEEGNAQTLTDLHWRMQRIGEQIALQQFNGRDVSVYLGDFRGSVL